ncbi:exopolysaccharide biosynthesis protein [Celeribacter litoreus]|uniref:exopolysaccharide biosynthesis protein n=1 Tax=Celeribacter litoreus TaxID=2876714 RepID=UPI001CC9915B|nr:exopolysaccharide biosynthesis protein [Celeribacter litoreus]MCA0041971.1 exopolysaccharide biosynthesis protein [Celeribacter litoreus]
MNEPRSVNDILRAIEAAQDDQVGRVSVDAIFDEIGHASFAPAVLVPALILVSPISGIPGFPTFGAIIIFLFAFQAVLGTDHLWLPEFIRRRHLPSEKVQKALDWLEKPANWIDERTETRLSFLAKRPWHRLTYLLMVLIAITIPALELLPLVTSAACTAISLMALGLMVRDGLLVLLGYLSIGAFAGLVIVLSQQIAA